MFPTLFLSHGSPMTILTDSPSRDFLRGLGKQIGRPDAIIIASAHWETEIPALNSVERNGTIHDFYGFPPELYQFRYDAPGNPELANRAGHMLLEAGFRAGLDPGRGLDHGAWVPLMMMYPEADIPTIQVGIQPHLDPAHHLKVGQALAPLRGENVLIVGSGSYTHNLRLLRREAVDAPSPPDVGAFSDWFDTALREHRMDDLLDYRARAPFAEHHHPTDEHLLPIYVALGAAGEKPKTERLHTSAMYGSLRMDAYAFG